MQRRPRKFVLRGPHQPARSPIRADDESRRAPPPAVPAHFLRATAAQWEAYWASPIGRLADPATDLPVIERLFSLRDERERAYRAYRKRRVMAGSRGCPRLNPAWEVIAAADAEIRELEDRFGLTPWARMQLGMQCRDVASPEGPAPLETG